MEQVPLKETGTKRGVPAFLRGLVTVTALAALLAGCPMEGESGGGTKDNTAAVVSLLNLTGAVTTPAAGAAPDTTAIDTDEYTGTVEWQNAGGTAFTGSAFEAYTVYKALVTLTAKDGFTFTGVAANSFTHTGAASVTNAADSGTVTVTFPATLPALMGTVSITGTAAVGETLTASTASLVYDTSGTLSYQWKAGGDNVGTNQSAYTIALADYGKTITVTVTASKNAGSVESAAAGPVPAITPANLASVLAALAANTASAPYTVPLAAGTNISGSDWAVINSAVQSSGRYVILDLSACTASDNTVTGEPSGFDNDFNIIQNNQYIKGVVLPDTLTSIGIFAFYDCSSLTSVTIGNGVTSIGQTAFGGCSSLTSVTIPASVTSVGPTVFYGCSSLTSVTFAGSAAVVYGASSFPSGASLLSAGGAAAGGPPMQAGTYTLSGGVWTKR
ncbi:MAG: leucine-rich repeat domain-containing protein [Treponematales bacterium]